VSRYYNIINNHIKLYKEDKSQYETFFRNALKKFNIKTIKNLSKDKKKEFFNYIDKNYMAKTEQSNSSAAGSYQTPFAFSKRKKKAVYEKIDFNKLRIGDIITDINNEKFLVSNKDKNDIYVVDLQSTNDKFWIDKKTAIAWGVKVDNGAGLNSSYYKKYLNLGEGIDRGNSFEKFLALIENMSEADLKFKLFNPLKTKYIDTPGMWSDDKNDYDGIIDFMNMNMGKSNFLKLKTFYNKNKQFCDKFTKRFGKNYMFESIKPEITPRKSIAIQIREVRDKLSEIEKTINRTIKLKETNKLGTNNLYKNTHKAISRIGEQITRILNNLQKIK